MNKTTKRKGRSPVFDMPSLDGSDCVHCGRCCHHPAKTVHLLIDDELRMGDELLTIWTEEHPPYFRFMKNDGDTCAALDQSEPSLLPCRIYQHRPQDCRIVEVGSPCCLEARRLGHLGNNIEFLR